MRYFRLILAFAVFVPAFAVLGGYAAMDSRFNIVGGFVIGGAVRTFFAFAFAGFLPRFVVDFFFGREEVKDE